jgi:Flp pilus assembly protein TadD
MIDAILDESECLVREGRLEEALAFVQEQLACINYARGHLTNNLGVIYAHTGDLEHAEAMFSLVVREPVEVPEARSNLEAVRRQRNTMAVLKATPQNDTTREQQ